MQLGISCQQIAQSALRKRYRIVSCRFLVIKMIRALSWVVIVILWLAAVVTPLTGSQILQVRGVVCCGESRQSLPNVYVKAPDGRILAVSDSTGRYTYQCSDDCPLTILFSLIGYADTILTLQFSGGTMSLDVDTVFLLVRPRMVDGMVVISDRLQDQTASAVSSQKFDLQQISAASGSLNDPLRFLQQSPSVTSGNDMRNDLAIRGGNPAEAVIMVEGLETANINHFGSQGSTGGPFGMIAANQVSEIRLAVSGYSVRFPNRLSGLAEIDLLGMDEVTSGGKVSLDLSGATVDLRLGSKTSPLYLLAHARKSYLDLLKSQMNTPAVPNYTDANIKACWRISPSQTITLFTLAGADRFAMPPGVYGYNNGSIDYWGEQVFYGIKWSSLLSPTSLFEAKYAFNYAHYDIKGFFDDHAAYYINQALERTHRFSCELSSRRSSHLEVNFGGSLKYTHADYPHSLAKFGDEFGEWKRFVRQWEELAIFEPSEYVEVTLTPFHPLKITAGVRHDFQTLADVGLLSPRLAVNYKLSEALTFFTSAGKYGQMPPLVWLAADKHNRTLNYVRASHYAAGINCSFTPDFRFTLAGYEKTYPNYPTTNIKPYRPMVDFGTDYKFYEMRQIHENGKGYCRGIELTLNKQLGRNASLQIGGALATSRYSNGLGSEIDGDFDSDYMLNVAANWRPFTHLTLSGRLLAEGGRPYTPIDTRISSLRHFTILDYWRLNQGRYPPYNRLDLKFSYDRHLGKNRLAVYLDIMNVYDRKNVYLYFWDNDTYSIEALYQFRLLPVAGISFEF